MKLLIFLLGLVIVAVVRAVLAQRRQGAPPPLPPPRPGPGDAEERVHGLLGPARHWFRDGIGQFKFGSYGGCVALTPARLLFVSTGTDGIFEGQIDARPLVGAPVSALFGAAPLSLARAGSFAIPLAAIDAVEAQKNRLQIRHHAGGAPATLTVLLERLFAGDEVARFAAAVTAAKAALSARARPPPPP